MQHTLLIIAFVASGATVRAGSENPLDELARKYLKIDAGELRKALGLDSSTISYQANWVNDKPNMPLSPLNFDMLPNTFPESFLKRTYGLPRPDISLLGEELLSKTKDAITQALPPDRKNYLPDHEIPLYLLCDILSHFEIKSPNKEYLGSIECYENALNIYPDSAHRSIAQYNLALSFYRVGALNKAAAELLRLRPQVKSRQLLHSINLVYAECLYLVKSFTDARTVYRRIFDETENESLKLTIMTRQGDIAFHLERYRDAYDLLTSINSNYPKYLVQRSNSYYYLAESAYKIKRYQEASQLYSRLARIWNESQSLSFILMRNGDILRKDHKVGPAKEVYLTIFQKYPGTFGSNVSGLKYIDTVLSNPAQLDQKGYAALLGIAEEVAKSQLFSYLRHEVLYRQALLRIKAGQEEDGITLMKAFASRYPKSYRYSSAMFQIEQALKRQLGSLFAGKAYTTLMSLFALNTKFIPIRSFNEEFLVYLCVAFDHFKLYRQIASLYEQIPPQIKRREAGNGVFHLWVAKAYTQLERNLDAIDVLQNIPYKTNDPNILRQTFLYLAETQKREKLYEKALEALDMAGQFLNEELTTSKLHFFRAEIYIQLDRHSPALREFRQTVATYAKPIEAGKIPQYLYDSYYYLADLTYRLEHYEEAMDQLKRFVTLFPEDYRKSLIRYRINIAQARLDDQEKGKAELKVLTQDNPPEFFDPVTAEDQHYYDWKSKFKRELRELRFID